MPLVTGGYSLAGLLRPLVAIAVSPWQVFGSRIADRIGQGLRTAPRDVVLAESVPHAEAGRAFGLHHAMDHAGAIAGPLLATLLLWIGLTERHVFALAIIPGIVAVVFVLSVKESARKRRGTGSSLLPPGTLPPEFKRYMWVLVLFCLANSSDTFLLLRAAEVGVTIHALPALWCAFHISKSVSSFIGGRLSDTQPRVRLIATGWFVYSGSYVAMAFASEPIHVWLTLVVYGTYHGLADPSEKALVMDLVPSRARGRGYGLFHFVDGLMTIPAGIAMGAVWTKFGSRIALLGASAVVASATILLIAMRFSDGTRPPLAPE